MGRVISPTCPWVFTQLSCRCFYLCESGLSSKMSHHVKKFQCYFQNKYHKITSPCYSCWHCKISIPSSEKHLTVCQPFDSLSNHSEYTILPLFLSQLIPKYVSFNISLSHNSFFLTILTIKLWFGISFSFCFFFLIGFVLCI